MPEINLEQPGQDKIVYSICIEVSSFAEASRLLLALPCAKAIVGQKNESVRVVIGELSLNKAEKILLIEKTKLVN